MVYVPEWLHRFVSDVNRRSGKISTSDVIDSSNLTLWLIHVNAKSDPYAENGIARDLERFRPYLYLLAEANLGAHLKKRVGASDLVQQTLMHAYQKNEQFRGESEAVRLAWLKQILRNKLIDCVRHWQGAKRDVRRDVALEQSVDESLMRVDDWLAANQTSPSQGAVREEQLMRLSNGLSQLPIELRDVVVMHHLQGMKLREIAEQADCNETTVGRRLLRGLKRLKEIMKE